MQSVLAMSLLMNSRAAINYKRKLCLLEMLRLRQRRRELAFKVITTANRRKPKRKTMPKNGRYWEDTVSKYTDKQFYEHFRVRRPLFRSLVDALKPFMEVEIRFNQNPIPIDKRVGIALWTLSSCSEFGKIAATFGIGKTSVHNIFKQFIFAMDDCYGDSIKMPSKEGLKENAVLFEQMWDYPMAVAAIDGCHIPFKCPLSQKTAYYNYKSFHSSLLLAATDALGKFMYINVGSPGRRNDAGVFRDSQLVADLDARKVLPLSTRIIEGTTIPYHILGDSAFPLKPYLIKTYAIRECLSQDYFDYNNRHSKARRVVENAFGRLRERWRRIGKKPLESRLEDVPIIIKVCCILHNMCEALHDIQHVPVRPDHQVARRSRCVNQTEVVEARDALRKYFAKQ